MRKHNKTKPRDHDGLFERPDSPFWWATWTDSEGHSTRRSTGIRKKDDPKKIEARRVRAQFIAESLKPQDKAQQDRTFEDLMTEYMQHRSLEKKSHARDCYACSRLAESFSGRRLSEIIGADVRAYVEKRKGEGVGPATINKEIGLMSAATNWARKELEWTLDNPWQSRKQKPPKGRNRWLTQGEVSVLMRAAEDRPRADYIVDFIRLGLYAGLRPGEILELEWSRVDWDRAVILFFEDDQKNEKTDAIPINQNARVALLSRKRFRDQWCPDSPWVFCRRDGSRIACIKKAFNAAVEEAGLEDVHQHDLRRTFGSILAQRGVPILTIANLMRHSDVRVTAKIYAHLAPSTLSDAVAVLDEEQPNQLRRVK